MDLKPAQIAKLVRTQLKLLQETGELMEGRYLVKTELEKVQITVEQCPIKPLMDNTRHHMYLPATKALLDQLMMVLQEHYLPGPPENFRPVVRIATALHDAELNRS